MSSRDFAKLFGVTHAAVLKWVKEKAKISPETEIYLRLYILNYLKVTDNEFNPGALTPPKCQFLSHVRYNLSFVFCPDLKNSRALS
jgi:transcriptional regulator with XRE-family HTH domain